MAYYIKRVERGYALVDEVGEPVPGQLETKLVSRVRDRPVFEVTFLAGRGGLQVIDERDE